MLHDACSAAGKGGSGSCRMRLAAAAAFFPTRQSQLNFTRQSHSSCQFIISLQHLMYTMPHMQVAMVVVVVSIVLLAWSCKTSRHTACHGPKPPKSAVMWGLLMLLQVKQAIPRVEERTYRKGQVLVEQGKVPEGLFLILSGD